MKIETIGERKIVMSNPYSIHNYFAWPTVARLQNGKIAVVASGYRLTHVDPFGKTVISYSEDEGETYTIPAPVIDTVLDDRDGGIATFGTSGVIVTSFNNTMKSQEDYAQERRYQAWSKEYCRFYANLISEEQQNPMLGYTFRLSEDCGVTFGPLYHSPVTSPHGPVELQDGTILWVGRKANLQPGEKEIQAYRIDLDGTSEFVGAIEGIEDEYGPIPSHEPHAYQLKDGTLLCHIRADRFERFKEHIFTIYQSESQDGGKTWSKPHPISHPLDGAPAHILQHSSGVVISACGDRKNPGGIRIMLSADGGKTWETEHMLHREEFCCGDLGYPATVELKDGSLLTVYYGHVDDGTPCEDPGGDTPAVILQQKWRIVE